MGKLPGLVVNVEDSQSEPWSLDMSSIPRFAYITRWIKLTTCWLKRTKIIKTAKRLGSKKVLKLVLSHYIFFVVPLIVETGFEAFYICFSSPLSFLGSRFSYLRFQAIQYVTIWTEGNFKG
jgi:hypothetical protein